MARSVHRSESATLLIDDEGDVLTLGGGGGGGGAPIDASYLTLGSDPTLTNEVLFNSLILRGTAAAKPAAGTQGRLYFETDGNQIGYFDSGGAWFEVARAGDMLTQTEGDARYLQLGGGTLTGDLNVPDEAYNATTWDGSTEVPTKNAIRDKIESLSFTHPDPHQLGDGSVGTPTYSFSGDTNTGLYRIGADNPAFAVGGVKTVEWNAASTAAFKVWPTETSDYSVSKVGFEVETLWTGYLTSASKSLIQFQLGNAANGIRVANDIANTAIRGLYVAPHITLGRASPGTNGPTAVTIYGMFFQPTVVDASPSTNSVVSELIGVYASVNNGIPGVTLGIGFKSNLSATLGTITTGVCFDAYTSTVIGAITTAIGLRITNLATGTTKWGMQIGNYQSYHEGDLRVGAISAGSTASPNAKLDVIQPTSATDVARFSTVATNDDPTLRMQQGRITTTNATPTTIMTIANPATTTMGVFVFVTVRRTGGASGTAEDGGFFVRSACFKNVAGAATEIGADAVIATQESQPGYDVTIAAAGGGSANILVQVTGIATTDLVWHATAFIFPTGT